MPDELGRLALQAAEVPLLLIRSDRTLHFSTGAAALIFGKAAVQGRALGEFGWKDPTLPEVVERVLTSGEAATEEVMLGSGTVYMRRVVPFGSNGTAAAIVVYIGPPAYMRASDKRRDQLRQASLVEQEYLAATRRAALEDIHLRATVASGIVKTICKEQVQTIRLAKRLLNDGPSRNQQKTIAGFLAAAADGIESKLQALATIFDRERSLAAPEHRTVAIQQVMARVAGALPASVKVEDKLHIVSSSVLVQTDPRLLTQALYALLTCCIEKDDDRLMLGCRRRAHELQLQFRCRPNRAASPPPHSGDSIWNPFAEEALRRLGHRLDRMPDTENVGGFDIFLPLAPIDTPTDHPRVSIPPFVGARGAALVVSGDSTQRKLLCELLRQRGFDPMGASDGQEAVKLAVESRQQPSLLVGDIDLPGHLDGGDVVALIRETWQGALPAILLRSETDAHIGLAGPSLQRCAFFTKPVAVEALDLWIDRLANPGPWNEHAPSAGPADSAERLALALVNGDPLARRQLSGFLGSRVIHAIGYDSVSDFRARAKVDRIGCALLDADLPGAGIGDFVAQQREERPSVPIVVHMKLESVSQVVRLMQSGATDVLQKPTDPDRLVASIERALAIAARGRRHQASRATTAQRLASLSAREHDILRRVLRGDRNKTIAYDLHISQRTVEYHRATIMKKMGAAHLTDLVRIVDEAGNGAPPPQTADEGKTPPSITVCRDN